MYPPGTFSAILGHFGPFWDILAKLSILVIFGHFWSFLDICTWDSLRTILDMYNLHKSARTHGENFLHTCRTMFTRIKLSDVHHRKLFVDTILGHKLCAHIGKNFSMTNLRKTLRAHFCTFCVCAQFCTFCVCTFSAHFCVHNFGTILRAHFCTILHKMFFCNAQIFYTHIKKISMCDKKKLYLMKKIIYRYNIKNLYSTYKKYY